MAVSLHSPNQQTKQQLEELDALLQRMLALPVNGSEPDAMPSPTLSMHPEAFAPSPPTLPLPQRQITDAEPFVQSWRVQTNPQAEPQVLAFPTQHSSDASQRPSERWDHTDPPMALPVNPPVVQMPPEPRFFTAPGMTAAAPAPFPYSMVFGQPSASAPTTMPATRPAPETVPPTPQWEAPKPTVEPALPFLLLPVVVLNRLFDFVTLFLGPLGSWLRQPSGRNTLGWVGLLMILCAIGWGVADWYGVDWTQWG